MHYLAACAIYRNEGPYLREWVEFHRLVGVEKFFLYDNSSSDDHREQLAPYVADGCVEVRPWPDEPGQITAYAHCLETRRDQARWIAFIDLDEFLFSPTLAPLPEILARLRAASRGGRQLGAVRIVGSQDPTGGARDRELPVAQPR